MIEITDATVRFGSHVALRIEHLALDGGELVAVMGSNGSGKTTLLRLIAGTLTLGAGTITGRPDVVAYVRQHPTQHSWMPMSAREIIRAGRYRHTGLLGRFSARDHELVEHSAERLEITPLLDRPYRDLSGGQRQRVLIASALATDAPCLLLDEPITGLDIPSQEIITRVAREERDRGRLVVLTTHYVEEAQACDRVILLATSVIADGTPEDALTAESLTAAFGHRIVEIDEHGSTGLLVDDHGHVHH